MRSKAGDKLMKRIILICLIFLLLLQSVIAVCQYEKEGFVTGTEVCRNGDVQAIYVMNVEFCTYEHRIIDECLNGCMDNKCAITPSQVYSSLLHYCASSLPSTSANGEDVYVLSPETHKNERVQKCLNTQVCMGGNCISADICGDGSCTGDENPNKCPQDCWIMEQKKFYNKLIGVLIVALIFIVAFILFIFRNRLKLNFKKNKKLLCKCGQKLTKQDRFCPECGKKAK